MATAATVITSRKFPAYSPLSRLSLAIFILATNVVGAFAADLPVAYQKAPPAVVVPPVYNWTGFYVGGNVGFSWGSSHNSWNEFFPFANPPTCPALDAVSVLLPAVCINGTDSKKLHGAIGGLQAGYNLQTGNFLVGLETDIQVSGQKGSQTFVTQFSVTAGLQRLGTFTAPYTEELRWLGTTRGRVGFTPASGWLIYATGGAAYGEVRNSGSATISCFQAGGICNFSNFGSSSNRVGWTAGAGFEAAIGGNWSFKAEYLHVDLGSVDTAFATPGGLLIGNNSPSGAGVLVPANTGTIHSRITDEIVRAGVNYRFGGPVVARY
jgi:outer membrane immunogenic protein